jgi:hypothetical protein
MIGEIISALLLNSGLYCIGDLWRMLCDYLGEETNIVNDWWKEFRIVCESLVSVLISVCEVLIEERITEFWYQP